MTLIPSPVSVETFICIDRSGYELIIAGMEWLPTLELFLYEETMMNKSIAILPVLAAIHYSPAFAFEEISNKPDSIVSVIDKSNFDELDDNFWRGHDTGTVGGSGGSAFTRSCGSGKIIGFELRSGSEIDRLKPICSNGADVGAVGGSGGSYSKFVCPVGYSVFKITGRSGSRIDAFQVHCKNGSGITYSSSKYGGNGGSSFALTCPSGMRAYGIYGRSGSRIDRFGLKCD